MIGLYDLQQMIDRLVDRLADRIDESAEKIAGAIRAQAFQGLFTLPPEDRVELAKRLLKGTIEEGKIK